MLRAVTTFSDSVRQAGRAGRPTRLRRRTSSSRSVTSCRSARLRAPLLRDHFRRLERAAIDATESRLIERCTLVAHA
jgi:hypothetical protein